jgi:hypothetical protein
VWEVLTWSDKSPTNLNLAVAAAVARQSLLCKLMFYLFGTPAQQLCLFALTTNIAHTAHR